MARKVVQKVIWEPHPGPQYEFLKAQEFEVLMGGGKGSGKSDALVVKMIDPEYINNPNYRGLLLRRTYPRLLDIKDRCDYFYFQVDPGCYYKPEEKRYIFSSGAKIKLGHCEHEADKYNYWGHEYQIVGIDQVEEFTESQYEIIRMSARTSDKSLKPIIRCTANPGVKWVKEYFYDVAPPGETFESRVLNPDGSESIVTRKLILATIKDNPTLLRNNPQYLSMLENIKNERLRRQMLYGDWEVIEDAAFDEFDESVHVRKLTDLFNGSSTPPQGWTVFATLDWGYTRPFAIYWHVITPVDRIITFREWYGIQYDEMTRKYKPNVGLKLVSTQVARGFLHRNAGLETSLMIADASIWDARGSKGCVGTEFEEVLLEEGIPMEKAHRGPGSRFMRKMQTHARLANAPDGEPWWLIADCCHNLIRTMKSLPLDPNNPDDIDTKSEDHAWDSVSYGFMHYPINTDEVTGNKRDNIVALDEFRRRTAFTFYGSGSLVDTYH